MVFFYTKAYCEHKHLVAEKEIRMEGLACFHNPCIFVACLHIFCISFSSRCKKCRTGCLQNILPMSNQNKSKDKCRRKASGGTFLFFPSIFLISISFLRSSLELDHSISHRILYKETSFETSFERYNHEYGQRS